MGFIGPFLGFSFNSIHSSELGIVRVSSGNRFDDVLKPSSSEITIEQPGSDGLLLTSTKTSKRQIKLDFAFDHMAEGQLYRLKTVWNDKKLHSLILDEQLYKVYTAKVETAPSLKYIAFEENGQRIYKGEGSISFVCYYPYARSLYNFIEDYLATQWDSIYYNLQDEIPGGIIGDQEDLRNMFLDVILETYSPSQTDLNDSFPNGTKKSSFDFEATFFDFLENYLKNNVEEWREAARLPSKEEYGNIENQQVKLFNAGDLPMPICIWYNLGDILNKGELQIKYGDNTITLSNITQKIQGIDKYLIIDTRNWLVYACDENEQPTGSIYNRFLTNSDFFEIELEEQIIEFDGATPMDLQYNYLFL